MNISQKLGRRIRALRAARVPKLTQAGLARKAGTTQVFIGLIERGEKTPSLQMLGNIAGALGVEMKHLFIFPAEKNTHEQNSPETILQEMQDALIAAKLSRQDLEMLKEITAVFCKNKNNL
ncbi:MAG: helix-turn-helix transcriptional regulator [Planctomycetes bacterium]|nr:helix-turn-helix transcriptional regulator [Planctomycetota bacterium]